jgi:hypothetical protein
MKTTSTSTSTSAAPSTIIAAPSSFKESCKIRKPQRVKFVDKKKHVPSNSKNAREVEKENNINLSYVCKNELNTKSDGSSDGNIACSVYQNNTGQHIFIFRGNSIESEAVATA